MKKDKLVEIPGRKLVIADVSTVSAAIIKATHPQLQVHCAFTKI